MTLPKPLIPIDGLNGMFMSALMFNSAATWGSSGLGPSEQVVNSGGIRAEALTNILFNDKMVAK